MKRGLKKSVSLVGLVLGMCSCGTGCCPGDLPAITVDTISAISALIQLIAPLIELIGGA